MLNSPWIKTDFSDWEAVCLPEYVLRMPKQTYVFLQNDQVEHIYIVKSGRVLLSAFSKDGAEKILIFIAKGGIMCEHCLFSTDPVAYSAKTVAPSVIYKVPMAFFLEKLMENQKLAHLLIQSQIKKENALVSHIVDLSFRDAYHRIIHELLFCADAYGEQTEEGVFIKIPISQEGMGKRVHTSRITVNKVLKQLSEKGLAKRKGQHFVLMDIQRMEEIDKEED